jgi:hypothetical protein
MAGRRLWLAATRVANRVFAQDPTDGARPLLYAATAPDATGGEYYGPDGFLSMRGPPERQRSSDRSYDEGTARRLWSVSERLTGVAYP